MRMNTKYIVIAIAVVLFAGIAFYLWQSGSFTPYARVPLELDADTEPVSLSAEEVQALSDAGIELPSGTDADTTDLLNVSVSDDLGAIEADVNETDLSGLDAELDAITSDLNL